MLILCWLLHLYSRSANASGSIQCKDHGIYWRPTGKFSYDVHCTGSLPKFNHPFLASYTLFSRTTWVSQKEVMGFWYGFGISYTICKQSVPRSRQITTTTPHHSIFTGQMLFLTPNQQCQSTEGNSSFLSLIAEFPENPPISFRIILFTNKRG